jgi:hypothetical protein
MRAAVEKKTISKQALDTKDATINFVPDVRALLSEWNGHLFLYLDHLELLSGNLIRSLGNSFRELIESEGADDAPDRFHLVWSGSVSIFGLRSFENSALAMCELTTFPLLDPIVQEKAVITACDNSGMSTVAPDTVQALITTTGAEPGFIYPLLGELTQAIQGRAPTIKDIGPAIDMLLKHGWQLPQLRRVGTLLLADEKSFDLGCRLADGEPTYRTEPIADIDRYQLFGMVVIRDEANRERYYWRNEIIKRFCIPLLARRPKGARKQTAYKPSGRRAQSDVPAVINRAKEQLLQLRGAAVASEIMAYCWTPLTNYPNHVTFSIVIGDLLSDVAYVVEITPEICLTQTKFSSVVPYFTPAAWQLCRNNLFVACDERESLAVLGIPLHGMDAMVVARIQQCHLQRQLTEHDLLPWTALILQGADRIIEAVLAQLGTALVRGKLGPSVRGETTKTIQERADLTFLAHDAVLTLSGKTTPYTGSFDEKWLSRISDQALDMSRSIHSHGEYRKRLIALSEDVSEYMKQHWPDLLRDLISLPDGIHLKIRHSIDLLRVPFELIRARASYLSIVRPTCRHILESRASQPYEIVIDALKRESKEPFSTVMIGPHKADNLARVEKELRMLEARVNDWCRTNNLRPEITILQGDKASVEQLEQTLRSLKRVHLLHFCGHGLYNSEDPENSSLAFLATDGEYEYVNCRRLLHVFEETQIWCLFLSCCYAGATSPAGHAISLLSGVVHAALEAKIPNIVTYRWQVSDEGAFQFATHFYEKLFTDPLCPLSEVIRACRRKSDGTAGAFDAWASSVLVTNNDDRP